MVVSWDLTVEIPSGNDQHSYGKSAFMGKIFISMAMFNGYFKLLVGRHVHSSCGNLYIYISILLWGISNISQIKLISKYIQLLSTMCNINLVGGWPTPPKKIKVNWDDEIPNIWINTSHVPKHQPIMIPVFS